MWQRPPGLTDERRVELQTHIQEWRESHPVRVQPGSLTWAHYYYTDQAMFEVWMYKNVINILQAFGNLDMFCFHPPCLTWWCTHSRSHARMHTQTQCFVLTWFTNPTWHVDKEMFDSSKVQYFCLCSLSYLSVLFISLHLHNHLI